jgi:8-oxo-dGTP diphosphatase
MKFATLCYIRRAGQTLMLHRNKKKNDMHEGKWNGLGGKLESGETPEECAIREVWEESGLRVREPQLKGIITFPGFAGDDDWYTFLFVIEDFDGELIDSPEGELAWIPDDELHTLPLWAGDHIFLEWLDMPGFFSGRFVYEGERLVEHGVHWYATGNGAV